MKISVLTPAYNAETYIRDLLESVRNQDYVNYEHIVIDDGSTDGTLEILRAHPGVVAVSRENRGQYATQNELVRLASGDVIVVICADDYFADSKVLSRVAVAFGSNESAEIVVGRTLRRMEGDVPYLVRPDLPLWLGVRTVRSWLAIQHCSVFVRRDLITKNALYFDARYRMRGDWDWLMRVFATRPKAIAVGHDFGVWRQHSSQTSVVEAARGAIETGQLLERAGVNARSHRRWSRLATQYSRMAHFRAIVLEHGGREAIRKACASGRGHQLEDPGCGSKLSP
jgi:glycosyltransferase involved in cell wall biosynthesis